MRTKRKYIYKFINIWRQIAWNCTITNFNKRHVLTSRLNFVSLCYKFSGARQFSKSWNFSARIGKNRLRSAKIGRAFESNRIRTKITEGIVHHFLLIVSSFNNTKKYNIFLFNTIVTNISLIVNFELISRFTRLSENFNDLKFRNGKESKRFKRRSIQIGTRAFWRCPVSRLQFLVLPPLKRGIIL